MQLVNLQTLLHRKASRDAEQCNTDSWGTLQWLILGKLLCCAWCLSEGRSTLTWWWTALSPVQSSAAEEGFKQHRWSLCWEQDGQGRLAIRCRVMGRLVHSRAGWMRQLEKFPSSGLSECPRAGLSPAVFGWSLDFCWQVGLWCWVLSTWGM